MKSARLKLAIWVSVILLSAPVAMRAQSSSDDSGAKQSMKNAGNDTRDAAHQAGTGIKQGTRKGYHKTKSGTDKAYHKNETWHQKSCAQGGGQAGYANR